VKKALGLIGLLVVIVLIWQWDFSEPAVRWEAPAALGKNFEIPLDVEDEGRGIRKVQVFLRQAGKTFLVFTKENEALPPWQKGPAREQILVAAKDIGEEVSLAEGDLDLIVEVTDQPKLWLFSNKFTDARTVRYDSTPPRIEVFSGRHYLRQGGSEVVLYRVFEAGVRSGVQVGENTFKGFHIQGRGQELYLCLFALAHDQPADTPLQLWAEDIAGNRTETRFWYKTFPQTFRTSRINLSDRLIEAVSRDILAHTSEVTEKDTPIETFVAINDGFRKITDQKILEITSSSSDRLHWDQPFLQLSNSKVESRFADHRIYVYEGEEVDRQTHLGFDLASVAQSAVEASNSGIVVFADYLGIYGNTVILDHGLGLFSFYGHLSSFDVEKGQSVSRGETLGRTGQSGLAAGDHLHFSMLVGEVQVNPLEWWDPKWVQDHVLSKWDAQIPDES
jgi:murein DD-endopeptidase MepM/ murein hydrolase activator NlpD